MPAWQGFTGINRGYVLELYDRFRKDPQSVDPETPRALRAMDPAGGSRRRAAARGRRSALRTAVGAVNLAQSIRRYGHLAAQLDPLGSKPLGRSDAPAASAWRDRRRPPAASGQPDLVAALRAASDHGTKLVAAFRRVYCSTTGYDYAHVFVPEERQWLRQAAEDGRFREPADPIDPVALLDRLTQVEAFERFLHRTFPARRASRSRGSTCSCRSSTR